MPIMAAHGQSDARGTARLLANMALSSISHPESSESQEVALNNMYRLLQSFRTDRFFGHEAPASRQTPTEKLTLRPPEEQNVRQVKEALQQATEIAFTGESKDAALEAIERVLLWIVYPAKVSQAPSESDRSRTATFFRELVARL
jgi:hypothetical protein